MNTKPAYFVAAIPIAFCAVITALWGYDGPYWDSWWKVPLIVEAFEGEFTVSDCWILVNEHRIFFPNLLTIPIAKWTHWTLGVELAISIVFAVAAFLIIAKTSASLNPWLVPVISLLMFSYSQHNIWMWGLHLAIPMTLLFMVLTVLALTRETLTWKHLALAILAAIGACYSFGAGVAVWGVGFVLIGVRRRWSLFVAWNIAAAIAMTVYFIGYESTPANTSAVDALTHPFHVALYIAAYLGGPLASWSGIAASIFGLLGILAVIGLLLRAKQNIDPPQACVPFALGLILIGLGCALLTALKGWPEGVNQAISSRYLAWPTVFWVGLVILLAPAVSKRTQTLALALISLLVLASSLHGAYTANERHDAYAIGRAAYIANENEADWIYLYPTADVPREMRNDLIKYRLTFFRALENDENAPEKPVE